MNNLLSYCGLVDVRINASDKDLPVYGAELISLSRLKIHSEITTPLLE